ncbi:hypothetical protein DERP_004853, partial [Dermatophagoides pteronyssinus]
ETTIQIFSIVYDQINHHWFQQKKNLVCVQLSIWNLPINCHPLYNSIDNIYSFPKKINAIYCCPLISKKNQSGMNIYKFS